MKWEHVSLVTLFLLVTMACAGQQGSTDSAKPTSLTTAKAQAAVDRGVEALKKQFVEGAQRACETYIDGAGGATVVGVRDLSSSSAIADLKFSDIASKGNSYGSRKWEKGIAEFIRYNDGRWMLTHVQTDGPLCGGTINNPELNIEVR